MVAITSQANFCKMTKTIYRPAGKICKEGKYHGCWSIYEDGTRLLIGKNMLCRYPTDDPFWKKPKGIDFKIKTRSETRKMKKPNLYEVLKYCSVENNDNLKTQELELNMNDEITNYVAAWY